MYLNQIKSLHNMRLTKVGPMARTVVDMTILLDGMASEEVKHRRGCDGSYLQCLFQKESNVCILCLFVSFTIDSFVSKFIILIPQNRKYSVSEYPATPFLVSLLWTRRFWTWKSHS